MIQLIDDAPPPHDEDAPADLWEQLLLRNQKTGAISPCLANVCLIFRHSPIGRSIAWDQRWQKIIWRSPVQWVREPRDFVDADIAEAAIWLATSRRIAVGADVVYSALAAEASRSPVDPVKSYLEALRWDGVERSYGWLTAYFGAIETVYSRSVARAWLIGAVARGLCPGSKVDTMLILISGQGDGKSFKIEKLAGSENYADVSIDPRSADGIREIHGPWVVEWGEMAGMKKIDAEPFKAFLTRSKDRLRVPYARVMENVPRKCIFIATSNESLPLNDPTGNRRYWPIECAPDEDLQGTLERIEKVRDQLWAEAVVAFRAGERWWLEGDLEGEARAVQVAHQPRDPWAESIELLVASPEVKLSGFLSTKEILDHLQVRSESRHPGHSRRISQIMADIGWKPARSRDGGALQRGYAP